MTNKIPLTDLDAPAQEQDEGGEQLELSSIHDFATKLTQPGARDALEHYVRWQVEQRSNVKASDLGAEGAMVPDFAPISINLDLTTACNFACDHCVDLDILNTGIRYDHDRLMSSLELMAKRGLRSVIVIGGGEPTLYPKFAEVIRFLKELGLQVAIVSNGTGNQKIAEVADCMDANDWVRLSLDSGTDATFQPMHKPRKNFTLESICAKVPDIKAANPDLIMGFSYIVTWRGSFINDTDIVENLHEIAQATRLARDSQFDYISFKPFLTRDEFNNAEVIDIKRQENMAETIARIQAQIEEAVKLETAEFRVLRSTGLKAMCVGPSRKKGSSRSRVSALLVSAVMTISSRPGIANSAMQRDSALPKKGPTAVRLAAVLSQGVCATRFWNIRVGRLKKRGLGGRYCRPSSRCAPVARAGWPGEIVPLTGLRGNRHTNIMCALNHITLSNMGIE